MEARAARSLRNDRDAGSAALRDAARRVPTVVRSVESFVPEVRRFHAHRTARMLRVAPEAVTCELPRVELVVPPKHVLVPGTDAKLLAAAHLVTHDERLLLEALEHTSQTMALAAALGLAVPRTELLLGGLVCRGFVSRQAPEAPTEEAIQGAATGVECHS